MYYLLFQFITTIGAAYLSPTIAISVIYAGKALAYCFSPLAGYIADNKLGRYKTIKINLKVLLGSLVVGNILIIMYLTLLLWGNTIIYVTIAFYATLSLFIVVLFPVTFGYIGFHANIVQFGLDQRYDSPADHQSLFIHWYIWVFFFVLLVVAVTFKTLYYSSLVGLCVLCFLCMGTLVLLICSLVAVNRKKHWFLSDTARINPYKLVYKVSKFAWQHKVPVHRSAFTYCEDELPTGLDLGKIKYGGPFTTEEVENVKFFYGILKIFLALGPAEFLHIAFDPVLKWYMKHVRYATNEEEYVFNHTIYSYYSIVDQNIANIILQDGFVSSLSVVILLLIYIDMLRPFVNHLVPSMLKRIGLGIIVTNISLLCTFAMDVALHSHHPTSGLDCMFDQPSIIYIFQDITPISIQCFLSALSSIFIYIALYEFICSQSPHSMKGFLIGMSLAITGLFRFLGAILPIPFSHIQSSFPSCGMYYYLLNIIIGGIRSTIIYTCCPKIPIS